MLLPNVSQLHAEKAFPERNKHAVWMTASAGGLGRGPL